MTEPLHLVQGQLTRLSGRDHEGIPMSKIGDEIEPAGGKLSEVSLGPGHGIVCRFGGGPGSAIVIAP